MLMVFTQAAASDFTTLASRLDVTRVCFVVILVSLQASLDFWWKKWEGEENRYHDNSPQIVQSL